MCVGGGALSLPEEGLYDRSPPLRGGWCGGGRAGRVGGCRQAVQIHFIGTPFQEAMGVG